MNILSYKNFVHYELYLLIFEHSLISDYRVQQYDTKGIKMSTILKQNRSDFLLFLVEFVTLFEDRINIAQMLDQFDCQARCTWQDHFLENNEHMKQINAQLKTILPII